MERILKGGEAAAAKGKIGVNGTFFGGIDMGVSVGGSAGSIGANGTAPFLYSIPQANFQSNQN